jgi:hypothetical protein
MYSAEPLLVGICAATDTDALIVLVNNMNIDIQDLWCLPIFIYFLE